MARDDDDDVIDSAVVKISPDLSGFRPKLKKDLDREQAKKPELVYKVKVAPDATGLRDKVKVAVAAQSALRGQPVYKVKLVADGTGFARTVRDELRRQKLPTHKIRLTGDGRNTGAELAAEKALTAETQKRGRVLERINRDRDKAIRKATKAPDLIDFGGQGFKPMNLLYSSVVALTPALFAMGASALQASTSVAALGSAGIGASLALAGLAVSFGPVSDALQLAKSVDTEKLTKSAKNAVSGADDHARALRDVADAQRDEKAAYAAIHTARQEAIRDLEDLRQAVKDLDNQYKSDQLSVKEAEQNERATNANFFATALERARAHQDTLDARARLSDTRLERRQKTQDLAKSLKTGIEGSDRVVRAREAARDARDRRLDAQATSAKRTSAALGGTSSAAAQLEEKLRNMAPAARDMFYWFRENDDMLKGLQRTIAQRVLPGFNTFLDAVSSAPKGGKTTLQVAAEYAGELGGIIGKYAGRFGEFSKTPFFRKNMATIQKNNATAFDRFGKAAETALTPILKIIEAASPLLVKFADKLVELAEKFDTFIGKADLAKWFADSAKQAGLWWDIFTNVATVLKDLFRASIGTGGSLVEKLRDFTDQIARWSSSDSGQKQLRGFFEVFRDLPYAQIRDFLIQFSEVFVAMRLVKWAYANPFFTALGILAASNPALATSFLKALTFVFEGIAGVVGRYPEATALVLGLVALAKLNKASGGILFTLTGVDKLKDLLTGKFKILDQILGGGAKTGTMTVHAAVVNVYGGTGAPGTTPGTPGAPGGKPGRLAPGSVGNLALAGGLGLGAALVAQIDSTGFTPFQKGVKDSVSGTLTGAALGTMVGGPIGTAVGAAIGAAVGLAAGKWAERAERMRTTQGREDVAFNTLKKAKFLDGYRPTPNDPSIANLSVVKEYVKARKDNVEAAVDNARATLGEAAAERVRLVETRKSVTTLSERLQAYDWSKEKADAYARAVYDLNGLIYDETQKLNAAKSAANATAASTKAAGAEAMVAADKFGVLGTAIDQVTGDKVITLTVNGETKVFKELVNLAAYQQVLRTGEPPTTSNINKIKRQFDKQTSDPNLVDKYAKGSATGGLIGGYSPNDRADNIPAWLTANEFVQPVAAVKHYGTDFMEAVRTRRFPKYAAGGRVDQWPFPVQIPPNTADVVKPFVGVPGTGDQEYTGRTPRGIGAVKGLTSRMTAAAIDAHNRFPWARVVSGLRRGAITVTGNKSYHGYGRATDWPASMELFQYFKSKYGDTAREIIYSPAGHGQIWRGKPHMYSGKVRATHWNHVHLALANGGQVPSARRYDTGGTLPPGYSLAFNGTGRNETVRTERQERDLRGPIRLDRRDITLLAAAMNTGTSTVNMDGRKVAELTNQYNYMPAGI